MAVCQNGEAVHLAGAPRQFFQGAIHVQQAVREKLMIDSFLHQVSGLWRDDRGADLVEYGLIAMIVALAGVVIFPSIGARLGDAFNDAGNDVYEAWEPEDPG